MLSLRAAVVIDYQNVHLVGAQLFHPFARPHEHLVHPLGYAQRLITSGVCTATDHDSQWESARGPTECGIVHGLLLGMGKVETASWFDATRHNSSREIRPSIRPIWNNRLDAKAFSASRDRTIYLP